MRTELKLFTHDGLFHADEVFATALLSLMSEQIQVVRGGDNELPEDPENWIIYDIGGGELDHHSPENKAANGFHPGTAIPYASCGLVWRKYYQEILEAENCPEEYMDIVYQRFENSVILGIDAEDNGFNPVADALSAMPGIRDEQKQEILFQARTGFTVSQVIKDFNPTWNSDLNHYDAFMDAVSYAKDIILNRLDSIISSLDGRDYVLRCIDYSANHIMIMDQFAPWEGVLYSQSRNPKAGDIWYVVSPALRGGWNIQCALEDTADRTSYRHPFPREWYGLRGEALQEASGVPSAIFCHVSGFLAGAGSETDALQLAAIAVKQQN